MKKVFRTMDPGEMGIVQTLMAEEGIETVILNEAISTVMPEVPFLSAKPELWVINDADEDRAKVVVERYQSGAVQAELEDEPWICPTCGEQIEGQFSECWNCADGAAEQESEP